MLARRSRQPPEILISCRARGSALARPSSCLSRTRICSRRLCQTASIGSVSAYYPEAKIVHTVREPDAWFGSTQASVFAPIFGMDLPPPYRRFFELNLRVYVEGGIHDRAFMTDHLRRHNAEVAETIVKASAANLRCQPGLGTALRLPGRPDAGLTVPADEHTRGIRRKNRGPQRRVARAITLACSAHRASKASGSHRVQGGSSPPARDRATAICCPTVRTSRRHRSNRVRV
jgi:Sulfotransferase domain